MPGPRNLSEADPQARGGQYVTVPTFAAPGHSAPANTRDAPGSTVVYSPKGWRWEEAGDDYSKSVSKLTSATMEGAVRRIKSSMGEVYYIRGTEDTRPPFDGTAIGDTCRVQDAQTLNIVAEWRWNGASWERMKVTSEQISNLDVGKLTAGSANIAEITARKIASDVGRFLEITTDQLTVTGNASFVNATAHHVWSAIVTAQQGEFEQIKAGMLAANAVSADNIQVGALNGQVITGATIQTNASPNRGLKIDDSGMQVYSSRGWKSLDINSSTGDIIINGRIGRRDTWSETYFDDILWASSGTDISGSGSKIGVGLLFDSVEDAWWPGALYVSKDSEARPTLKVQAPLRKAFGNTKETPRPYLSLSSEGASIYSGSEGGSLWGSLAINKYGLSVRSGSSFLTMNDSRFSYNKTDGLIFQIDYDTVTIKALKHVHTTNIGFYMTPAQAVMGWAGNAYWVDSGGVHMSGTKKFTMRVPEVTERTGMWLSHSCTESPYDGIEYWENLTLDAEGKCTWELPDYVPWIASKKAPWMVLCTSGKATLEKTGYGREAAPWKVHVEGEPNSEVSVLVKGARIVDTAQSDGSIEWIDYARRTPWELGLTSQEDGEHDAQAHLLGGGYYGPALPSKEDKEKAYGTEQAG